MLSPDILGPCRKFFLQIFFLNLIETSFKERGIFPSDVRYSKLHVQAFNSEYSRTGNDLKIFVSNTKRKISSGDILSFRLTLQNPKLKILRHVLPEMEKPAQNKTFRQLST